MTNGHWYNCKECVQWDQREDGSYGCTIIDLSHGSEYPIKAVTRDGNSHYGEMVCQYYEPQKTPTFSGKIARKTNVCGVVKKCSACRGLVHKAARVCPHCSAEFLEVENEQ